MSGVPSAASTGSRSAVSGGELRRQDSDLCASYCGSPCLALTKSRQASLGWHVIPASPASHPRKTQRSDLRKPKHAGKGLSLRSNRRRTVGRILQSLTLTSGLSF